MNLRPALVARVYATADALRERHPELRSALTWDGFRSVLSREGVLLARVPLGRPAKLMGYEGTWIILVDSDRPARHLGFALHEFGHLKMHVDDGPNGRYEQCFHMDDLLADDPRELEADLLAELLVYGWER